MRRPQPETLLAPVFAAGLRPAALADANVRLAVESGTPPARQEGADDGTVAFRDAIERPDAARLREAPLPASTKLYLLRRATASPSQDDVTALTALTAFERMDVARATRRAPGAYDAPGAVVLVPPDSGPLLVSADARNAPGMGPFADVEGSEMDFAWLSWTLNRDWGEPLEE